MIGQRRTGVLIAIVGLLTALCCARLAQIQVLQHDVWAEEAAGQVRSGVLVPAQRGALATSDGRVLVSDQPTYTVALAYRAWRRGHPLGQVAHARSALELRALPLTDALEQLEAWALELVALSPAQLARFAAGEPLAHGSYDLASCAQPEAEDRRGRASDARYYIGCLLELQRGEWARLARVPPGPEREQSFVELTALWREQSAERVRADLCARLARSVDDLRELARALASSAAHELDPHQVAGEPVASGARVQLGEELELHALVLELERYRRAVEELAASWTFAQTVGLAPGRIDPRLLWERFDLRWLAVLMRWEEARCFEWVQEARARWRAGWLDRYALPSLAREFARRAASATVERERESEVEPELAQAIASCFAAIYARGDAFERALQEGAAPWHERAAGEWIGALAGSLAPEPAGGGRERVPLAFQDPRAASAAREDERVHWAVLERAFAAPGALPQAEQLAAQGAAALAQALAAPRAQREERVLESLRELASALEARFQVQLELELGPRGEQDPHARLQLSQDAQKRAWQSAPYALKDYGSRALELVRAPSFEVVQLLTRHPDAYRGFEAREANERRVHLEPGESAPPAGLLLGQVSSAAGLTAQQEQREQSARLRALRRKPERSASEERELSELAGESLLAGQLRGVSGIEGCFDPWLRGSNGFRELLGLESLEGRARSERLVRPVRHGSDLVLTLSAELQRAAEHALAHPEPDPDPAQRDEDWLAAPVGAIVLMRPNGEVLAAASGPGPRARGEESASSAGAELDALERALHAPGFQPPGSVFKPFAAAWALQHLGLDPSATASCTPQGDGFVGYKNLRCLEAGSHRGEVGLKQALVCSCNAYFAWLGEQYASEQLLEMAHTFGFGEPTGVRPVGAGGRIEDVPRLFRGELTSEMRMRAANGLVVIQATPLQVARAFAGLATGVLPSAQLAARIGAAAAPRGPVRELGIEERHLETVRAALCAVVDAPSGTAHRALGGGELRFSAAAKTGSADLTARGESGSGPGRKHGWVAGWLPQRDPALVFVVFVHDTTKTASHSAVWVARQLLRDASVVAWIERELAARALEAGGG
jgi:cell division protein FtsI/penicillin-binding protein 2